MLQWNRLGSNILHLLFPNLCQLCRRRGPMPESTICLSCDYYLPRTGYASEEEQLFTERFWGRMPLQAGSAYLFFAKGGRTQRVLHRIKYNGKTQLGRELGRTYGYSLKQSAQYQGVDVVIPVPLHPKRLFKRGYNQAAVIGEGIAEGLGCPLLDGNLIRVKHTSSQVRERRLDRFANVENAFMVTDPASLENKHVLLVDDVLTTGATLEACGQKLLDVPGLKLSCATLAIAMY